MEDLIKIAEEKWSSLSHSFPTDFKGKFEESKNTIVKILQDTKKKADAIMANPVYAEEEKQRQKAELLTKAWQQIDSELGQLQKLVEDFKVQTYNNLLPQKPKEIDQGELLNVKADLQMLLNSLEPRKAMQRMATFLSESIKNGNVLTAWLLSGSGWPQLYLESRGLNPAEWEPVRNDVIKANANEKQAEVWSLLKEGRDGIDGFLRSLKFAVNVNWERI